MLQHVGDELFDGRLSLPEQRQPEALGEERVRSAGKAGADVGKGVAKAPVRIGQTLPYDVGRVHVRALPEGCAQRGCQRIGIARWHHRHAIDGRVVDLGGGSGIGKRDIDGEDIDF